MKNTFFALFALLAGVVSARTTLFDIVEENEDLSTLQLALELTDLDGVLDCSRWSCPWLTAFAPNNAAFAALDQDLLTTLTTNTEFLPHLRGILSYHVSKGRLFSGDIRNGGRRQTLLRERVETSIDNGDVFINDAKVLAADIHAFNGLAHVIDAVLIPSFMQSDITGILEDAGHFTTLLAALEAAGLTGTLGGPGPFTVFAPIDEAFAKLPEGTVPALLDNIEELTKILTYHVVNEKIVTLDRLEAGSVTTLQGEDIIVSFPRRFSYPVLNGEVEFEAFDVLASNGVIHVISDVLIPPTSAPQAPSITEIALGFPKYSILVSALQATGLDAVLKDDDGPFTVFAPTNAAFERLGVPVSDLLADIDGLTNILQYHVVSGAVFSSDLEEGTITALNGQEIEVDIDYNWWIRRILLNDDSRIVDFDVPARNGVIHTINEVLIPQKNIPGTVIDEGDFSILVTALTEADLVSTLEGPGPFTVFAPTDAAFSKLGQDLLNRLLADTETLSQILLYHVVSGDLRRFDLRQLDQVNTVQNEMIHISTSCVHRNGRRRCTIHLNDGVGFDEFNIDASNGVIHTIDEVLIPPSLAGSL